MIKVYGDVKSGNCYKIQLVAALLEIDYQWVNIDILRGETQTPGFIEMSPNGKIPIIELADGRVISESNAIVNYLAWGSELLPLDAFVFAKIQQWQFFEQYSHEPYIAVARFINKYLGLPADRMAEYKDKQSGGVRALEVMEKQLAESAYLVGDQLSVADISLYAYTHVAHEGGFELQQFPSIQRWLASIKGLDAYQAMS